MSGARVPLSIALGRYPWTAPLLDGEVTVEGVDLTFAQPRPSIITAFRLMVRELAYDVSELAWITYALAREHGSPLTALPIFPFRRYPHGVLTVSTKAGIRSPGDLAGARVAMRGYTVTPGVYARALLAHDHGLDLDAMTFVLSAEEHVEAYRAPVNVEYRIGDDLVPLLRSGDIQAAVAIAPPDGRDIVALFDDIPAGEAQWRSRDLNPVNHVVAVQDEVLVHHPQLATALTDAFAAARQPFLNRLSSGRLEPGDAEWIGRCGISSPDSLADGISANRNVLGASLRFAVEQHVLTTEPSVDDLFHGVTQPIKNGAVS